LKGIVDFGAGPVLVEGVFDTLTERPFAGEQPRFGITVIGWKITAEDMMRAFAPAIRAANTPLVQIALTGVGGRQAPRD